MAANTHVLLFPLLLHLNIDNYVTAAMIIDQLG